MKNPSPFSCLPISLLLLGTAFAGDNWPGFRGDGSSVATDAVPPLKWSESENVAWSVDLPGLGQSSPVIWGNRVYVTSAEGVRKQQLLVLAFDLVSGQEAWRRSVPASVQIEATDMVSRGAPTPMVDAQGVYAFFESGDVVAISHKGEIRWQLSLTKDHGPYQGGHGLGSSPAQTEDHLLILADHEGPSYLLALDKATGETAWKDDRPARVSWTSPIVQGEFLYISSNGILEKRKAEDGTLVWSQEGLEGNTVASASVAQGENLVVIGSSQPQMSQAFAADTGNPVWKAERVTSSFGSPLIAKGAAYFVNRSGGLQCTDLADGSLRWETRLLDSCWASPVLAAERLYFFCKNGSTVVLEPSLEEPKVLAENTIDVSDGDRIYGVAFAGKTIVARSGSRLVGIREP